jgi:hypothetical protein
MKGRPVKNKIILALSLLAIGGAGFFSRGQFTPSEIAQREEWEEYLKTADIVKSELIGEGVTKPWKLYLKKGTLEKKAAWKNPEVKQGDFIDSWKYEIAAYRLDKLIGLNMVPITIEREFKGKKGALSLWADSKYNGLEIAENNIPIPDWALKQTDDMKYITRFWDSLIANDDRTQENYRFTEDWRTIIIDHSRAFRSNKENMEKLMCGANGIKRKDDGGPYLIQRVPRALFEKIKALDLAGLKQAVGSYLTDQEVEAIIARKPLLIKEIGEMIKKNGEKNVLY